MARNYMENDFSVSGREKYLCRKFYDLFNIKLEWEFTFARQTLLQRIVWLFKPDDTCCTLDGFDLDEFYPFDDGFIGIGRARHLSIREEVPIVIALEFNRFRGTVKRGLIWVGQKPPKYLQPTKVNCEELDNIFLLNQCLGRDWQLAFMRNAKGWSMDNDFDLSILLTPLIGDK